MRLHRRVTTWLALLAVVLGALAPTVTQAMVAGQPKADWLEICSVTGMVWVQPDTGATADALPDDSAPQAATPHCSWCMLHGAAAAPWPAAEFSPPLPDRLTDLPPAFYLAPQTASVWLPTQSRAPPLAA